MAIKKSDLYSSLWASADELRGSMDASQYKDYVLVLLFVKYISDRYANQPFAPIQIPEGSSFADLVKLKGKATIGDDINKKILGPIADANKLSAMPDFNDPSKLGIGKDMETKLTKLIAIFENPALDFRNNRADGDDILGDAYEYLMRHFATESGKSKGQFYTPAEVSRIMAKIIGINKDNTTSETSVYDPTCGSGSLLLKVADEAEKLVSVFGQENDTATASLSRMNMILHNNPTAVIMQGNTLANPLFKDESQRLMRFDYIVANPPFSFKSWGNGVNIEQENEDGGRFYGFGVPPTKNGDFAFLLHMVKSLKSNGKAAVILPHGVLFRGNAEAEIRTNLIRKGLIKGIVGLPANLFYGTGIPACLILIDKEHADSRKGIFMIDAGKGFAKDGNKNRLREQDIHKIVDVFNKQLEIPKYSRMVPVSEIEKNDFNLNIPRYIDSTEPEDLQNIEAHLLGGIPDADIEALANYWDVYPNLRNKLFKPANRPNFLELTVPAAKVKEEIFSHPEFISYTQTINEVFGAWKTKNVPICMNIGANTKPKEFIKYLSEDFLLAFANLKLIDKYDVYQHLMSFWIETGQDDCYLISADGWVAKTYRIIEKGKNDKETDKGWACDLVPKKMVINRYFSKEQADIEKMETEAESTAAQISEMEEEHSGEDGFFASMEKISKTEAATELKKVLAELKTNKQNEELLEKKNVLEKYIRLAELYAEQNKNIKSAKQQLDNLLYAQYPKLTETEVKDLVINDRWMNTIEQSVNNEMQRISQRLTQRIKELAERYETPVAQQTAEVKMLEEKVNAHLAKMGFVL